MKERVTWEAGRKRVLEQKKKIQVRVSKFGGQRLRLVYRNELKIMFLPPSLT